MLTARHTGLAFFGAFGLLALAATLPLEMEVLDWPVPDPVDFNTVVSIEQSPYGVAKQYKVPLWSDKHWELIEASIRQLARVGNDWWHVPVLLNTEFGNKDDSPIKWIRKKNGTLAPYVTFV